jgi:hypothetical protein
MEAEPRIHKFEAAGLGKAPFRFVGVSKNWFVPCPGEPGKPGGSCDYCGTGIAFEHHIKSADGKRFKVGSECVLKTGDAGLKRVVNRAKAKHATELRHLREARKIEEALEALPLVEAKLAAEPHPLKWRAEKGETLLDSVVWFLEHAGNAGKLKVARIIMAAKDSG